MHVRPRSQNPWQLASPLSSVVVGGVGGVAVGVDGGGGVAGPTASLARGLTHVKIRGSRSTRLGERATPHRYRHSSATSSCRIWTRPPTLHESACSTVILTPQPSQAAGISSGEWLYLRRTLSLHSSADRPVPFNRFGNTDSHAPAAQFRLSRLATEGLSRPRPSRKSCSSMSRDFLAACPASMAHERCAPWSNLMSLRTSDTVRWRVAASEAEWTL